MANEVKCPGCDAVVPKILVCHEYSIDYSEEQKRWVKQVGWVTYSCANCEVELNIFSIEDILKQVDEL